MKHGTSFAAICGAAWSVRGRAWYLINIWSLLVSERLERWEGSEIIFYTWDVYNEVSAANVWSSFCDTDVSVNFRYASNFSRDTSISRKYFNQQRFFYHLLATKEIWINAKKKKKTLIMVNSHLFNLKSRNSNLYVISCWNLAENTCNGCNFTF